MNTRAITVIEVLVVLAVVAILATILIPAINRAKNKAQHQAEQELERFVDGELSRFSITREVTPGTYPTLFLITDTQTSNQFLFISTQQGGAVAKINP